MFAKVNTVGQFMLRELLEASAYSKTHRLRVSKTRLLFVIQLGEGSNMTPQIKSRLHLSTP